MLKIKLFELGSVNMVNILTYNLFELYLRGKQVNLKQFLKLKCLTTQV